MKMIGDQNKFAGAANKKIISLQIHGLDHAPVQIRYSQTDDVLDKSLYSFANGTLEVTGLDFPIDDGLIFKNNVDLLHFIFV